MLHAIADLVVSWAEAIPLPAFVFLGSVIEEVIAPIPSPIILAVSGSIAAAQGYGWLGIAGLIAIASAGKTLGGWVLYIVGDKGEHFLLGRFGRAIGLSHREVEHFSHRFTGGWKDDLLLFGLRCIPIVPSAPLSVLCGVLKIPMRTYLTATFLGSYIRSAMFFLLGYLGADTYQSLLNHVGTVESALTALTVVAIAAFLIWCYWRRRP